MSRLPIPHFIQEIKAKLGFDRTMTAPGEDVVDAVNKQSQQIANVKDMISDAFSTSATYAVGDYCIYNNALYKCTTAVTTAGAWTGSTNWTATAVDDEIKNRVLFYKNQAVTATTGDIVTINDSRITTDHVLTECVWANPSYITTDVNWDTDTAGQLKLNGTCTTATTVTITLVKKDN